MAPRAARAFLAAVALAAVADVNAVSYDAKVTQYTVQTAEVGSCRLKGISTSSDNFKYYASVSSKDVVLQESCARCIRVTKEGLPSLTAYVVDVCQGCKSGELKLSSAGLSALSIDPNLNNATATYRFINCPSNFLSGSVSACLMEGASNSYIPLQFYNSNKVVASATISGINATQSKDSYFFFATPPTSNADTTKWFQNVQVSLTSKDGETQSGTFQFGGTSGCAASTFQFARVASDGDDDDGDASANASDDSGGKSGLLIPVIIGVVCALLVIAVAVFVIRRRRASKSDDDRYDHENQFPSPVAKGPIPPISPGRPTYAVDNSMHNSTDDPSDGEPNSPAGAFDDAVTPTTIESANRRVFETINEQRQQQQLQLQQEQQQQQLQRQQQQQQHAAPKVAYNTYVAPQTYSYSKPVVDERGGSKNLSARGSSRNTGPTFPAPKLPSSRNQQHDDESGEEGRSSFDIDDMRETEEIKERQRLSSMGGVQYSAGYVPESAYAAPTVTSPQSYVRATTLRRASSKVPADRPTLRFTSTAPPPPPAEDERRSDSFAFSDRQDSYDSDGPGSSRNKTASGYSSESLGILGYPYAKKNSGRGSLTEAQL